MGFRFRKSINFGIFRVNASKTGLGWSVGVPGARYTKMANGRNRVTANIPGTGMSWVKETKKGAASVPQNTKLTGWPLFWHSVWQILKFAFWTAVAVFGVLFVILCMLDKKGGLK